MASPQGQKTDLPEGYKPWPALWAMVIGFFMILVDNTIVFVATPAIARDLNADANAVIWVTSAYLLAYAVPLLVTGRLGDQFGPKRVYLVGLTIFTLASLWCGLTGSIEMLIVARVVQGIGASLITPQTMAVITRTFPPAKRGSAMALWGATAGVATLVGPILGGVLVDSLGWEWIFFINVPVGIVGFIVAVRLVPVLKTHPHTFDLLGVALSGLGMFLIVFGIQEGEKYHWGTITGIISVPLLISLGLLLFAAFIWWQSRIKREPLVPLGLFRDRNFSLGNGGIALVSLAITAMSLPIQFYAQGVRGWSPTQAALLMVPMAVVLMVLSPFVGKLVDRAHPRNITLVGFSTAAIAMLWLSLILTPTTPVWQLLLPMALFGVSNACLWAPLSATATRNLPMASAGAGAGVYNTTRQIGAVLGSAAIASLIEARLAANALGGSSGDFFSQKGPMPAQVQGPFADAMAQSLLLPVFAFAIGIVAVLFFAAPSHEGRREGPPVAAPVTAK
ncbi:MFS transporter [Aeromicrobium sp. A1-2]|uniref:MFS transporter n=1 Tax=Aeromicrobium sp. A1-2 TaxID=2107713 RepID=UPI000E468E3D|nr:MFS transporter [Aeromicrobium sp. A1-2]AXT84101.1 MFS transporter [Aeromicrobium sp. A1-2]